MDILEKCPCGSRLLFKDCCHKAHQDIKNAHTAAALMRSRYSAYVTANTPYLLKSWHASTRPTTKEAKELTLWTKSVHWVKLEVLKTKNINANKASVHFKAYYYQDMALHCIEENSYFTKQNGHWVYVKAMS